MAAVSTDQPSLNSSYIVDEDPINSEGEPLIIKPNSTAQASSLRTSLSIYKAFVGTGVLFLPSAFRNGGWLLSTLIVGGIGLLALYCMLQLLDCWDKHRCSYGELADVAYGKWGVVAINVSLCLTHFGICCAYLIFFAETIHDLFLPTVNVRWLILATAPIMVPFTWIRHLWKLAPVSILAAVLVSVGLLYLFVYHFIHIGNYGVGGGAEVKLVNDNFAKMALMMGTAVFSFEGIGMVVPLQESMKEPEKYRTLMTFSVLGVISLFVSFGLVGYLTYGEDTQDAVTKNLPEEEWMTIAVQIVYGFAVFLSYPLIGFPAIKIVENVFWPPGVGEVTKVRTWKKNMVRAACVFGTIGVAIAGADDLENFVAIVGGFCATPLCFIYPSIFHYKLVAKSKLIIAIDLAIVGIGVVLTVFTSVLAVADWIIDDLGGGNSTGV